MYISVGVPVPGVSPTRASDRTPLTGAAGQLQQQLAELFRLAQLSNVNVYTFDPAGLDGLANYFQSHPDANADATDATDYLRVVADNTGGRAIVDTNNAEQGIAEMVRESGSYYLLAYQSSNPQQGREVPQGRRARRSPGPDRAHAQRLRRAEGGEGRRQALAPPVPSRSAGLAQAATCRCRCPMAPFAVPGKGKAAVGDRADVHQPAPTGAHGRQHRAQTGAYGPEGGKRSDLRSKTAKVVMRPTPDDTDAQFEVLSRIDLKPGRYNLRFGATSTLQDKTAACTRRRRRPGFREGSAVALRRRRLGVAVACVGGQGSAGDSCCR